MQINPNFLQINSDVVNALSKWPPLLRELLVCAGRSVQVCLHSSRRCDVSNVQLFIELRSPNGWIVESLLVSIEAMVNEISWLPVHRLISFSTDSR